MASSFPSKIKQKSSRRSSSHSASNSYFLPLLKCTLLSIILSLTTTSSLLASSPVYGFILSAHFTSVAPILSLLITYCISRFFPSLVSQLLRFAPLVAFYIPLIQAILFRFSSYFGPTYGPLITDLFTIYPIIGPTILQISNYFGPRPLSRIVALFISYITYSWSSSLFLQWLPHYMNHSWIFTRIGLQLLSASLFSLSFPSLLLFLTIPSILYNLFLNPHNQLPFTTARLNNSLARYNYTLLNRSDSVTGYLSVLESHSDNFRVLRCDHSLLGGEWLLTPDRVKFGQTEPESVYAVFTMLESIRLVDIPQKRPDTKSSALVIGLGIGSSPKALINLGIDTTIVEIDPIVHEYATRYFGLPTNHTAFLEDAQTYVSRAIIEQPAFFDYIIHDVFTGGAEPIELFTIEFISSLYQLLRQNGVIVINYVEDSASSRTETVFNTIYTAFHNQCNVYREAGDNGDSKVSNMMVFCTKQTLKYPASLSNFTIPFRLPEKSDFGASLSRRNFIPPRPEWKINFKPRSKSVLHHSRQLTTSQDFFVPARNHWKIMRNAIPTPIWELW